LASLLLCLVVSGLPSSIIPSSNGGDNLAIFKESAFSVISEQWSDLSFQFTDYWLLITDYCSLITHPHPLN
jgi:hypothetical protein